MTAATRPGSGPGSSRIIAAAALVVTVMLVIWVQRTIGQPRSSTDRGAAKTNELTMPGPEPVSASREEAGSRPGDEADESLQSAFRVEGTIRAPEDTGEAEYRIRILQAWDGAALEEGLRPAGSYRLDHFPARPIRNLSVIVQLDARDTRAMRKAIVLQRGVPGRVDFDLRRSPAIEGRVTDLDGVPLTNVSVCAVPWTSLQKIGVDSRLHPAVASVWGQSQDVTAKDGSFRLRGLDADSPYRIVSLAHGYEIHPVRPYRPASDLAAELTARLSATVSLTATDVVTGERISTFRVRAPSVGLDELTGSAGLCQLRVTRPTEGLSPNWGGQTAPCVVEAEGYIPREAQLLWGPTWAGVPGTVKLSPRSAVNVVLDVRSASGEPFDGEVLGVYALLANGETIEKRGISLLRTGPGTFEAVVPAGRAWLAIWPRDGLALEIAAQVLEIRPDETRNTRVVLPPMGRLRLRAPPLKGTWVVRFAREGWRSDRHPGGQSRPGDSFTLVDTAFVHGGKTITLGPIGTGAWTVQLRDQNEVRYESKIRIGNAEQVEWSPAGSEDE